jgi:Ser/Thr protein kinase RdoA (MazF antagonist)
MEKEVESQFNNDVLHKAAEKFGINRSSLKKLGSFENYVYEVEKDGISYILRLTHSSHRNINTVLAELEWIAYLAKNGVRVAKANPSIDNLYAEKIPVDNGYFIACLFDKALGRHLCKENPSEFMNDNIIREWGRTIGQMHRLTKGFIPESEHIRRPDWDEDDLLSLELHLPNEDVEIIKKGKDLLEHFEKLPKNLDTFGLIHTDPHSGNFFVNEGEITIFDFDDSSYQFFISDIAIAIYYSVWKLCSDYTQEEKDVFANRFLTAFMEGYNQENRLDSFWYEEIPYFLRLRDLTLYSVFHKKLDVNELKEYQKLLSEIRDRIIRGIPVVNISYYN